jgi:hypothetical protein
MAYRTFRGIGDYVAEVHFTAASTIRKAKNVHSAPANLGETVRFLEHFSY